MVTRREKCQKCGGEFGKSTFLLLLAKRKDTPVSFDSNGDNLVNKRKVLRIIVADLNRVGKCLYHRAKFPIYYFNVSNRIMILLLKLCLHSKWVN